MTDSKFQALVRLLEDTDPEVSTAVEAELLRLGPAAISRLERAWEKQTDSLIQSRLEDLIDKIQFSHLQEELMLWKNSGGHDLIYGWLLLTQIQYPTINLQKYRNEINRLVNRIFLQINTKMTELEKLSQINTFIYRNEGYTGNYREIDRPENNYLSILIDTKNGNPISLSSLYLIICQLLDENIPIQVVNLDGYYALRYINTNTHFYIDAFNKGMFFTPKQVELFLHKRNANENVLNYPPMSNLLIIHHLILHLIYSYKQLKDNMKANRFLRLLNHLDWHLENPNTV
jgi:regulator of sirC expression with transglutaminase-like and TPR domain